MESMLLIVQMMMKIDMINGLLEYFNPYVVPFMFLEEKIGGTHGLMIIISNPSSDWRLTVYKQNLYSYLTELLEIKMFLTIKLFNQAKLNCLK